MALGNSIIRYVYKAIDEAEPFVNQHWPMGNHDTTQELLDWPIVDWQVT